ncbi:MAG: membrane dipeptidase, partial [Oscillospiraceae bacterium]|nr:membrane dipeptidase [Oscillospiraceae bacterium]
MIPLFDAHCDTASKITAKGLCLRENDLSVDLESCRAFSPHARVFAIFNDLSRVADIEAAAVKQIDYLLREISENCELVALCTDGRQARAAFSQGKIAAFLSVEGAEQLGCSADRLKWAYG